jgi:hypothetical protein
MANSWCQHQDRIPEDSWKSGTTGSINGRFKLNRYGYWAGWLNGIAAYRKNANRSILVQDGGHSPGTDRFATSIFVKQVWRQARATEQVSDL